jgi:hypothetical protein
MFNEHYVSNDILIFLLTNEVRLRSRSRFGKRFTKTSKSFRMANGIERKVQQLNCFDRIGIDLTRKGRMRNSIERTMWRCRCFSFFLFDRVVAFRTCSRIFSKSSSVISLFCAIANTKTNNDERLSSLLVLTTNDMTIYSISVGSCSPAYGRLVLRNRSISL